MQLETKVYQRENNTSLFRLFLASLRDIYNSRFLSKQLAVRDIKSMYRQSYLGILWAFITPLTTAIVWIFLSSSGTIKLTDTGMPYPLFVFTGTLLWSILVESINLPMSNTNGARGIMAKINFPKEALVISGIYKLLFNSGIKLILLLGFMIIYKVGFFGSQLLFPLLFMGVILFGTTIGLFITPIGMLYKDVSRVISLGLRFVMFVTPVVYTIPETGMMRTVMMYNPLTPLILTTRNVLVGAPLDYLGYYFIIIAISIPLFFIALIIYRISIPVIVERLSA